MFIAGHQARSPGQLVLKAPKFPGGFQQSLSKVQVREGCSRLCDQLVHNNDGLIVK